LNRESNENKIQFIENKERNSSEKNSELAIKDHEDKVRQISELIESKERLISQSDISQELTLQEKENCNKQKKELDNLVRMLEEWKVKIPTNTINEHSYNQEGNEKLIYNERWNNNNQIDQLSKKEEING